jgi:hypothetical protein
MATEVKVKTGTPVVWADTTDFSASDSGYTRTHQLDLTSIANNAARQGDKGDLGATRARRYVVRAGIEFGSAPAAGLSVEVYWSSSFSSTAGTGNDGGASGADGAYKAGEEDEWKKQLTLIGFLVVTNDGAGTVQRQTVSDKFSHFEPPTRYGMPIVVNKSGQTLDSDAINMFVALEPILDEIQ